MTLENIHFVAQQIEKSSHRDPIGWLHSITFVKICFDSHIALAVNVAYARY